MEKELSKQEKKIEEEACKYVRDNAESIIQEYAGDEFKPDTVPVSVFMAGSPGAGKTEFSKAFIDTIRKKAGYAK